MLPVIVDRAVARSVSGSLGEIGGKFSEETPNEVDDFQLQGVWVMT